MTRSLRKDAAPKRPATDELAVEVDGEQVVGFISQDDDEITMAAPESGAIRSLPERQPGRGLRRVRGQSQSTPLSAASLRRLEAEDDADASGEEAERSSDKDQVSVSPGINATPDVQPTSGLCWSEGVENAPAKRLDCFPGKAWRDQAWRLLRLLDKAPIGLSRPLRGRKENMHKPRSYYASGSGYDSDLSDASQQVLFSPIPAPIDQLERGSRASRNCFWAG